MKKNLWLLLTLFAALTLVLAACAGGGEEAAEPAPEQPAAAEEPAAEEPAAEEPAAEEEAMEEPAAEEPAAEEEAMAGGSYLERAMAGEFSGTSVTMMGPFTDEDEVKFNNAVAEFEEQTGIDIQYTGTKEFEATISVRVDAGDAPDIVDFPQPGLLANFVASGDVLNVLDFIDEGKLQGNYNQSWLDMATMAGPDGPIMAGVWHRFNGKSLVWYPKDDFEAAGYEVPQTWDELIALSDLIVDDGDAPWCVGIESGAATGWPATDWMEEVMLRTTSLENYDAWVLGALPFSSPEVTNAAETLAEVWFADGYVLGGQAGIVSTFFGDAPTPMFEEPPRCWMHKQGNFITSFFPAGSEAGVDYDFFYFPSIDEQYGKPFLVAGDIMSAFNDRDEVRAVMEFFSTGESVRGWLGAGGALSPHLDASLDWYGDDIERGVAALVQESTSFRFDGSDLMPGEVGAGSFWTGMTDWASGAVDLETALQEIDASWPARTAAAEEAMEEEEAMVDADSFLGRAMAGEFSGTSVTMMGPFTDEDEVKFNNAVAEFEEQTGIDIQYTGTKEFEATISVRVDAGDAPDIVDFPQPGLLANFVASGDVLNVLDFIDEGKLQGNYNQSWLDMATMAGPDGPIMAGVWHRFNGKSLVWYPKDDFEAAGYEVPQTWDELIALSDLIVDDGDAPWCVGIESGAATGWPATDWMEEVMLRTTSLENYDAWVLGALPFSSPEVTNAAETLAEVWFADGYVLGGQAGIVSTFFGDAPTPMFEEPPRCWMHKQGNFITSFFPAGSEAGVDYDFFYFPSIDEQYGKPFLVAGDIMSAFNDRDEVRAVMEFFSTGESVRGWLGAGGALSPHLDASLDWYGDDIERGVAALVQESTSFRFDGSDLMPGEVGAGSFWTGMTDWASGAVDLETALQEIDASWPK
jgi:alpha-glucoside transport system substrate-binding protein